MDTWLYVALAGYAALATLALVITQTQIRTLVKAGIATRSKVNVLLSSVSDISQRNDRLGADLTQLRDHVGVVTPEQLQRLAAVDHLRAEYRSIGLAVDADELDETQLQELERALLTLKTAPVRRETDTEVDQDLQALFDGAHPDNIPEPTTDDTGPLPHAQDGTDEIPFNGGTLADWPGNPS